MSRLICESCDHGYDPRAAACPWCGALPHVAHVSHAVSVFDTECYPNYWAYKSDTGEKFVLTPTIPLDIAGLRRALSLYTLVSFNGLHYDIPMISLALQGHDNATLKAANDAIIVGSKRPWEITRDLLEWCDHIDMIEVAPGQASLKMYMAKMHSRKLQDLPFDSSQPLEWWQIALLDTYHDNDLAGTRELYDTFQAQLKLREDMSAEYGIDLRSKSDAQIAEAVMKALLSTDAQWQSLDNQQRIANAMGRPFREPHTHSDIYASNVVMQSNRSVFKVERPYIAPGTQFKYRAPEWLRFQHLHLLQLLDRNAFTIAVSGSVEMPDELANTLIRIGSSAYKMGIGGLHSTESQIVHVADDQYEITDHDVASYYPSLILRTGIAPQQIGQQFQHIYRQWYDRRLAAKRGGDKKTANSLKTLLNGTFGKLGSMWSIFYAPSEMIQVTVTGQLALLMLIEMLELHGISVISANTDGIVLRTRRDMTWARDQCIAWWESVTQFETERTDYTMLASRDVNSFGAVKPDGTVKLKGAYAPPDPGPSGWPNPTGQVCVDAVVAYLAHETPLRDTVYACQDVRQFVYVRQVKGGGSYLPIPVPPKSTTLTAMRAMVQGTPPSHGALRECYAAHRERVLAQAQYLGKAVRWYYATGSTGCIITPAGGLVARTEGCAPLMKLPDALPVDIDREWYVREAQSLLTDMGVMI